MMIAALVLVVVLGTALIGSALTDPNVDKFVGHSYSIADPNRIVDKNVSFTFEQSVQGDGYFMTYKYAKMGDVEFKDYAHGSGSLDNEAILASYDSSKKYHLWTPDWYDMNISCIQYKETSHMVYAPTFIPIGTGFYAANPLNYDSLLKEKTWIKNRRTATSMQHEVEYAHQIDKDLKVFGKVFSNFTYDPIYESLGQTQMSIKEDVKEGKIHIGVLQGNNDKTGYIGSTSLNSWTTAWKNPAIEIDEDYFGTYHVEKNMSIEVPYKKNQPTYDWLPCTCQSGWDYLTLHDQRYHSAKGFFDCAACKFPYCGKTY
jgi:hypothetical protein